MFERDEIDELIYQVECAIKRKRELEEREAKWQKELNESETSKMLDEILESLAPQTRVERLDEALTERKEKRNKSSNKPH